MHQELDSSLEEASALRERFREAEARFNDASKDAAGVAETTREELTLMSEQRREFEKREEELKRRVEGLQEVIVIAASLDLLTLMWIILRTERTRSSSRSPCLTRCFAIAQEACFAATKHTEALKEAKRAAEEAQADGLRSLQSEKVREEV